MVDSSYLFINQIRLHYLKWGEREGIPAVLLHGLASNAHIWDMVAPILVEAGLAPRAPDGRGHGLSDGPDGDYGFDTYLRDLAAFLETCQIERPLLVGHSWGANVALEYAARFPAGRLAPAGIVLVDGGMTQLDDAAPGKPRPTWEEVEKRLTPPRLAGTLSTEFAPHIRSMAASLGLPEAQAEQAVRIVMANFEIYLDPENGEERIRPYLSFEHHMQIVRSLWEFKTYERFSKVRCPALLIPARQPTPHDEGQAAWFAAKDRGAAQASSSMRNVKVNWMEDTIHDIPLQRPAELARMIVEFARGL
jgi:pimeloyl-ACP methyl ester carboxylesterase